jgi:hypothetical protein
MLLRSQQNTVVSSAYSELRQDLAILVDVLYGTDARTRKTVFFCFLGIVYAILMTAIEHADSLPASCPM